MNNQQCNANDNQETRCKIIKDIIYVAIKDLRAKNKDLKKER